jgi:hypothetical protein
VHVEVLDALQGLPGLIQESHAHTEALAIDHYVLGLRIDTERSCASQPVNPGRALRGSGQSALPWSAPT